MAVNHKFKIIALLLLMIPLGGFIYLEYSMARFVTIYDDGEIIVEKQGKQGTMGLGDVRISLINQQAHHAMVTWVVRDYYDSDVIESVTKLPDDGFQINFKEGRNILCTGTVRVISQKKN